jgi:hypothetical protein
MYNGKGQDRDDEMRGQEERIEANCHKLLAPVQCNDANDQ